MATQYNMFRQEPAIEESDPVGVFVWHMQATLEALELYLDLNSVGINRIIKETKDGGTCALSLTRGRWSGARFEVRRAISAESERKPTTAKVWVVVAIAKDIDCSEVAIGRTKELAEARLIAKLKAWWKETHENNAEEGEEPYDDGTQWIADMWADQDTGEMPQAYEEEVAE